MQPKIIALKSCSQSAAAALQLTFMAGMQAWRERVKKDWDAYCRLPDPFGREYDEIFSSFVGEEPEPAVSWESFCHWLGEMEGGWAFRGQRESDWTLQTSLDREVRVVHSKGHYPLDCRAQEDELLFLFQQQAHNYIAHPPSISDRASWLALMQHYGVPTRLLDWTSSPYVALYFALEERAQGTPPIDQGNNRTQQEAADHDACSAVWAIDLDWLDRKAEEHIGSIPKDPRARTERLNALLDEKQQPLIVRIDPSLGSERMYAQQGFFLWKLFEHAPFFDQILISMMTRPELPMRPVVRKLRLNGAYRIELLEILRSMNIHRASLFPGIDGFSQSLKFGLQIKVERERRLANLRDGEGARG